jgi:hypothetical protein
MKAKWMVSIGALLLLAISGVSLGARSHPNGRRDCRPGRRDGQACPVATDKPQRSGFRRGAIFPTNNAM